MSYSLGWTRASKDPSNPNHSTFLCFSPFKHTQTSLQTTKVKGEKLHSFSGKHSANKHMKQHSYKSQLYVYSAHWSWQKTHWILCQHVVFCSRSLFFRIRLSRNAEGMDRLLEYVFKSLSKRTGKEIFFNNVISKLHCKEHPTHMASFSFSVSVLTKLVTLYEPHTSHEAAEAVEK